MVRSKSLSEYININLHSLSNLWKYLAYKLINRKERKGYEDEGGGLTVEYL